MGYSIVPTGVKSGYKLRVKFFELDGFPERAELALAYNQIIYRPQRKKSSN